MRIALIPDCVTLLRFVPFAKYEIVSNADDAWAAGYRLKWPVVLKLLSEKILHKQRQGAIAIAAADNIDAAWKKLEGLAVALKIQPNVLVQEYVKGFEFALGLKRDPTFGQVVMFGSGGTAIEKLKDVSFRACPISQRDAEELFDELSFGKVLLEQISKRNLLQIQKILIKLSRWALKHPDLQELDINPLIVNKEVKAVDARAIFE